LSFFLWQWWASISIGLLAVARLLGSKLNLYLLVMLVIAYSLYTLYVVDNYSVLSAQFGNLADDLNGLSNLGSAAEFFIEKNANPGIGVTFGLTAGAVMLFLGTIGFLAYSFVDSQRNR
jgi:hypothetical protein